MKEMSVKDLLIMQNMMTGKNIRQREKAEVTDKYVLTTSTGTPT